MTYLYHTQTKYNNQSYYYCPDCKSVAMHPKYYLSLIEEKTRYLTHNNDVDDPRYQKFVRPVIQAVTTHTKTHDHGLDFGAGTGPVITKLLQKKGYSMTTYDPIFIPNSEALSETYDFIVCCEVVEHFHNPRAEFMRFHQLLKPDGLLVSKPNCLRSTLISLIGTTSMTQLILFSTAPRVCACYLANTVSNTSTSPHAW